ncbi:MAG: SDR family oxidoreductase [Massilia sp.]
MRILLTGSTGLLGRALATALLAEGHELVCAVRKAPPAARPGERFIHADFTKDTDKSVWLARLAQIDVVVNAVGIFRESGGQRFDTLHTATPCALFAACAEIGTVQQVVQVSALGADSAARSRYHLSKKAADDYLAMLPVNSAIVQPSLIYASGGASARVFRTLASMPLCPRFGKAPQLVQPIDLDDAVAAIVKLIDEALARAAAPEPQRIALVGPQAMPFTDYLAFLRAAMGMGRLRVLPLPSALARMAAAIGGLLPGSLLDPEALAMLDRGNSADPAATTRLLGHPPRPVTDFVREPRSERQQAKLGWLLPLLRLSIAAVWIGTAIVSARYPLQASYELLARSGVQHALQPLMLAGAIGLDLLLGLGTLLLARRRRLWQLQLALIGFYTVVIAVRLPEFVWHPYGPLLKNLPMLAAIWLLLELEEE